jgi:ribulose-phosphate 3-epimerase
MQLLRRLHASANLIVSRPSTSERQPSTSERSSRASALLSAVRVAPSILSADFGRLREQVGEVLAAGARVIHVDVMDGHFVPPITLGPVVVEALREQALQAGAVLDVHLMIERPERHVAAFAKAGADSITFHIEATAHGARVAELIAEHGAGVGVAINPATPVEALREITPALGLALCMTVNPGWGGQEFIPASPGKVQRLRALLDQRTEAGGDAGLTEAGEDAGLTEAGEDAGLREPPALEVDGGIDPETAPLCRAAGASLFVAGSAVFTAADPGAAYLAIARSVNAD